MNKRLHLLFSLLPFSLAPVLSLYFTLEACADNVNINWGNSCDTLLYDETGDTLADSSFVQLIKKVNLIDEPGCQGNPDSNDVVKGTSRIGRGVIDPGDTIEGCFSQNTTVSIDCNVSGDSTDTFYVRAWNDSTLNLATYYGDTRQHVGQNVWIVHCKDITFRIGVTDSNSWNTGTEAPNVVNVSGTDISPAEALPGTENVGMLQLDFSTNKNTSEMTALRVINKVSGACTVDSLDIDTVKIYKETGDSVGFQPSGAKADTLIESAVWGGGSTPGGEQTITISPSETLTTTTTTYYIAYDIESTADPNHCVGACLDDSSFISVNSPDCVSNDNFPICSGDVGLPVELSSFTATPQNGAVLLEWRTESEFENQGFHLHRSLQVGGPYIQITDSLIPGAGTTPIPHEYSYTDEDLVNGMTYFYKLEAIGFNTDYREIFGPISATPTNQYGSQIPASFFLYQAKPSPFGSGGETMIHFDLPTRIHLTLKIYDVTGKLVQTLVDQEKPPGMHLERWNGKDENGKQVSSGVYFYRLSSNQFTSSRKVLFLR
jgi:hypothetical protein